MELEFTFLDIGQRFLGALKYEKLQLLNLLSVSSCDMVKCLPDRLAGRGTLLSGAYEAPLTSEKALVSPSMAVSDVLALSLSVTQGFNSPTSGQALGWEVSQHSA